MVGFIIVYVESWLICFGRWKHRRNLVMFSLNILHHYFKLLFVSVFFLLCIQFLRAIGGVCLWTWHMVFRFLRLVVSRSLKRLSVNPQRHITSSQCTEPAGFYVPCVKLILLTQLPVEPVLWEQIGCSNSQSVTFPHPGCWPPYKERHYISLHNNTAPALRWR